jgi:hypothetical protein
MAASKSLLEWIWSTERRQGKRQQVTTLAAYYWDGAAPRPHPVTDISSRGMYLLTERRWYRNTLLQMTLVRSDKSENEAGHSIRLTARVVRSGRDGVGFAFVFPASSRPLDGVFESDATQASLKKFLAGVQCEAASWSMSAVLLLLLIPLAFCTEYRVVLVASLVAARG